MAAGTYAAVATVITSDEDLLGATNRPVIVNLSVVVGSGVFGDISGDGSVNSSDLGFVLSDYGDCLAGVPCISDLNGDNVVDSADVGLVLGAFN